MHFSYIFSHSKSLLTKVLLDIKTLEVFLATLTIVRPPLESWYKSLEPGKKENNPQVCTLE